MKGIVLSLILLLSGAVSHLAAQTYNSTAPFICDEATHFPYQVTSFSQFQCRGVTDTGNPTSYNAEFFLFSSGLFYFFNGTKTIVMYANSDWKLECFTLDTVYTNPAFSPL